MEYGRIKPSGERVYRGRCRLCKRNSTIIDPDMSIHMNAMGQCPREFDDFFHLAKPMLREASPDKARLVGLPMPSARLTTLSQTDSLRLERICSYRIPLNMFDNKLWGACLSEISI
jgi:hypothetical protein